MSKVKKENTFNLKYLKNDQNYKIDIQQYERQLDKVKRNNISFLCHKYIVEENDAGAVFCLKLSIELQGNQSIDYYTNLISLLQKKLVFQLSPEGTIRNIYNLGEIREFWDDHKRDVLKEYKNVDSIKSKIQEVSVLLENSEHFLQYILDQEIYQLLFPCIYNSKLVYNQPIRSNKKHTNIFKNTILPVLNYSFFENIDTKKNTIYIYDIETTDPKDFDNKLLLEEYKSEYNTGDIDLEYNTIRNYSITSEGYIKTAQSIKKIGISDFENKEQITHIELLIQPD